MIQQTSLTAYKEELNNGGIKHQRERVFYEFRRNPASDQEVATNLFLPASTVSARRNELIKQGRIIGYGIKQCQFTGKRVMVWGIVK